MAALILRRLIVIVPLLLCVAALTFGLMHAVPGGPWDREKALSVQAVANLDAKYHLNDPLPQQFAAYVWGAVRGDFGPSYTHPERSVADILRDGLGVTLQLGASALLFGVLIGVPLGALAALKRGRAIDHVATLVAVAGISVPNFVIGTFAIAAFAAALHWLPSGGWDSWRAWILPPVALGLGPAAILARHTRSSLLEITRQDHVRAARARGLGPWLVATRHELRNALLPLVTVLGPISAHLAAGSFVVEEIFHIPGVGRAFVDSVLSRDYPMIMATALLYAAAVAIANLLVDVSYGVLDPRIRG